MIGKGNPPRSLEPACELGLVAGLVGLPDDPQHGSVVPHVALQAVAGFDGCLNCREGVRPAALVDPLAPVRLPVVRVTQDVRGTVGSSVIAANASKIATVPASSVFGSYDTPMTAAKLRLLYGSRKENSSLPASSMKIISASIRSTSPGRNHRVRSDHQRSTGLYTPRGTVQWDLSTRKRVAGPPSKIVLSRCCPGPRSWDSLPLRLLLRRMCRGSARYGPERSRANTHGIRRVWRHGGLARSSSIVSVIGNRRR